MKRIILIATFYFACHSLFSQANYFIVKGKVLDATSHLPMQGASVFAENTTLGTATDQEGNFTLYLPNGGYDLIVSFTSFTTQSARVTNADNKEMLFELAPKEKTLQDFSITSSNEVKNGWEKYGKFFLEEFIGKTSNADSCTIQNPESLTFYYSKRKNRLKVLAKEPVLIINKYLGYQIRYELDSFVHEYNNEMSVYTGYPLFEAMKDSSEQQQLIWKNARKKAYKGSELQFMRSLYNMQLEESGYEVQFLVTDNSKDTAIQLKNYYDALNYDGQDSTDYVKIYPNQLKVGILFKNEKPTEKYITENPTEPSLFQFSILNFQLNQPIYILENGYFYDQNDISVSGYWSWEKIANALPYDYQEE